MLNAVSIVGARPQFIKLAPICRAFAAHGAVARHQVIHTGQHYDTNMSDVFFGDLDIPAPDRQLAVGSGSHGEQTGAMLAALEQAFIDDKPDVVIVYGDTNSTLAAVLAAAKLHIPTAHVEAGLRSFNRLMPEEVNRLVADHCADRLYAPTPEALQNLEREGLSERTVLSGDVMLDAVRGNIEAAQMSSVVLERLGLERGEFGAVTIHRPSNTDAESIANIIATLERISQDQLPLVFPMHPRTRAVLGDAAPSDGDALRVVEPLGYADMLTLVEAARLVITDSGGLQKEAAFLGTSCITLREETEWTETLAMGANRLVGQDAGQLDSAVNALLDAPVPDWSDAIHDYYGSGNAAELIVGDLVDWVGNRKGNETHG